MKDKDRIFVGVDCSGEIGGPSTTTEVVLRNGSVLAVCEFFHDKLSIASFDDDCQVLSKMYDDCTMLREGPFKSNNPINSEDLSRMEGFISKFYDKFLNDWKDSPLINSLIK